MVKLIHEKVLQAYFKERYGEYEVEINGKKEKISGVTDGPDFPDLYCSINGKTVHCEVEWLSSKFDHFNHKLYQDFRKHNGFLLVFDNDKPVSDIQQITVKEKDFRKWFTTNSGNIFDDSVEEFKTGSEKRRKHAKIWIVYTPPDMGKNLQIAKKEKTWGWRKNVPDMIINKLQSIKQDDLLVFFGPTINTGKNAKNSNGKPNKGKSIFARMKGTYAELYKDHIKNENYEINEISVCTINKSYWNEIKESLIKKCKYKNIWKDETVKNTKYPHRVKFEIKFSLNGVKLKKLNDATNEFLRTRMQGKAIGEMSYQYLIELIRR